MILSVLPLRQTSDVLLAREKVRAAAAALALPPLEQTRLATACAELARAVADRGGGELSIGVRADVDHATVGTCGLVLEFRSTEALRLNPDASWDPIRAARVLADEFTLEPSGEAGSTARIVKLARVPATPTQLARVRDALQAAEDAEAIAALRGQNRELVRLLQMLRQREQDLERQRHELEALTSGLQALSRRKDELLAEVAHDLRSPLAAVHTALEELRAHAGDALTPGHHRLLDVAGRASRHVISLINDLIDSALVEAGLLRVAARPTAVPELLEELLPAIELLAADKRIGVAVALRGEDLCAAADPPRLRQILWNLLSNAVKFTAEQGAVRVEVERTDGVVTLRVHDSGVGIAPDRLATLFDRLDPRRTRGTRGELGNGLGLHLCRRLVELHQGTITVASEPGRGSVFEVRLPAADG